MRSGEYQQRAVLGSDVVEVAPQRDHLFENRCRRFGMRHAALRRPVPETCSLGALLDGDDQILMPGNRPGCAPRLVEEDGANGPREIPYDLPCERDESRRLQSGDDCGLAQRATPRLRYLSTLCGHPFIYCEREPVDRKREVRDAKALVELHAEIPS